MLGLLQACIFNFSGINGSGILITTEKTVDSFEKITISSSADVVFFEAENSRVVITVDDNLIDFLEIESIDNILEIGTQHGSYSFTEFKVEVYGAVPNTIIINGSGSFVNEQEFAVPFFTLVISGSGTILNRVACETYSAVISGSGRILLEGSAESLEIQLSGSGQFSGIEFQTNRTIASLSGSGNIEIFANEFLEANISGSGNILYRGDAKLQTRVSGLGTISSYSF